MPERGTHRLSRLSVLSTLALGTILALSGRENLESAGDTPHPPTSESQPHSQRSPLQWRKKPRRGGM